MAELGETNDPRQLVPGNPAAIGATAKRLRSRADALEQAGVGLKRIDTVDGWSGPAGDAFRAKFQGQPGGWLQAAASFFTSADALDNYATTLAWAQRQATQAIAQWNAAQSASQQALTRYRQYRQQGGTDPFQDPGDAGRRLTLVTSPVSDPTRLAKIRDRARASAQLTESDQHCPDLNTDSW